MKQIKKKVFGLISILLLMVQFQCVPDAPHSNPLDPFHILPNHDKVDITGYIFHKNFSNLPVDSCLILLTPGEIFAFSDESGRFSFNHINPGEYQITVSKPGYQPEMKLVQTDTLTTQPLILYINGLPKISHIHLQSQYIDQWWPDPFYSVTINLRAEDPDGPSDIKEIRLQIPELSINEPLHTTTQNDSFALRMLEPDFPFSNIFLIVGQKIYIELMDRSDTTEIEGPFYIHRIIESSPLTVFPTGLATVSKQPVLIWQNFNANFSYHYEIQVFIIIAGIPSLIHTSNPIESIETQYNYPDTLNSGQYYWTILVRDQFGNTSRSKEATFQVP